MEKNKNKVTSDVLETEKEVTETNSKKKENKKSSKKTVPNNKVQKELDDLVAKITEIQSEKETVVKQNEEYEDMLKRHQAEFDNYRKRVVEERSQLIRYAPEKLLNDFLNIYDNFDKAISVETDSEELRGYIEGFRLIKEQIDKMLQTHGVKESTKLGDDFNPSFHQAIQIEDEGGSEEKVKEIYQKGYFLHDRMLREAMVKIHKTGEAQVGGTEEGNEDEEIEEINLEENDKLEK